MISDNLGKDIRKFLLLGVGAAATTVEKSQDIIDKLVEKGELTVKQGQALNEELTRKAKDCMNESTDIRLRTKFENMTQVERAEYAQKVAQMAKEVDEKTKSVTIPVEEDKKDEE